MSKKSFVTILTLLFLSCKDDGITPPTNPLQLTVEDVSCTEAFLKLSLVANEPNRTVIVKRNDSVVTTITLATVDTLITEVNLLPKKTYTYTASAGSWKTSVQITTLDTTSHTIHWQTPDTLGVYGLIRDVWVFSRDNAWAVGEIFLRDSNGVIDNGTRYNGAHWDGMKWTLMRIPYYFQGQPIYNPLYCVFAFNENDIWFAGNGVIHWNGQQHIPAEIPASVWGTFLVNRIWGTSSNNIFIVGDNGSIAHYSNGTWTKMESHTTVDLQDVWGIDNEHVWATGTNIGDGHSVVLQYDGKQWTTIYDNANKPPNEKFGFRSVWTDRIDRIYLAGGSRTQLMNLNNKTFQQLNIPQQQWVAFNIRGINRRDIFQIGSAGETVHFNGVSWYLYPELKLLNEGFAGFNSVYPTTDFVLIGGLYLTALNGFPVVIRGYR